ncbi:MAG: flippase-like domain-containing protein, partial [Zoogloeaceae bacterium]|nr:flippase-like domain-containing protein [Zoogloeaceae bacterium]
MEQETNGDAPTLSVRRFRMLVWTALLAMLVYLACILWNGWEDVLAAARKVGFWGVALALVLSLVNYLLRFARWRAYLAAMGHHLPWRPNLNIYLAGFALTATPGKAGEALRGALLKRWGVPWADSFAAFLSERLSDLLGVILLTLAGLARYPAARWPIAVSALAMLMVF